MRDKYLRYRRKFNPKRVKLVIVAESPPKSPRGGPLRYFYNPDGRVTESLFAAMMQQLKCSPTTKVGGLREFQRRGWVLVDATYRPVNKLKKESARNAVIDEDYHLLRDDLATMLPHKSVPIILVKANVCRRLKDRLRENGFNVVPVVSICVVAQERLPARRWLFRQYGGRVSGADETGGRGRANSSGLGTLPERPRHSMHVPLCFSKRAPSGCPGKKEMFETLDARQLPGFRPFSSKF
jgi:hypothetical protein